MLRKKSGRSIKGRKQGQQGVTTYLKHRNQAGDRGSSGAAANRPSKNLAGVGQPSILLSETKNSKSAMSAGRRQLNEPI